MKNLNVMKHDVMVKLDSEFQTKFKKYKCYMDLISKCFSVLVPPKMFDDVASYITNKDVIRLRYHNNDTHYIYIDISADLKSMNLKIERFFASDVFYNKNISILSNDTDIVEFFDREFDEFVKWFRTDRYLISVNKLVEALNDSIFRTYEKDFYKLNINEYNFENLDYSFKLGVHEDEIISKIQTLCKESELKL